jgi:hypothetical protein
MGMTCFPPSGFSLIPVGTKFAGQVTTTSEDLTWNTPEALTFVVTSEIFP